MISRLPSAFGAAQQPPTSANINKMPTAPAVGGTANSASAPVVDEKLKKSAQALEGLFVQQLFKAMRDTVPQQEGIVTGGAGEDIFTSLMDEHLATETPKQWEGGLAEALYRQLRGPAQAAASQASAPHPASSTN
ncbi:MAG: rod-binding protein [Gemmatimonadaceae bacterium]|nr:rod-binding protein [Gemmatimonadaceae bacterium]